MDYLLYNKVRNSVNLSRAVGCLREVIPAEALHIDEKKFKAAYKTISELQMNLLTELSEIEQQSNSNGETE